MFIHFFLLYKEQQGTEECPIDLDSIEDEIPNKQDTYTSVSSSASEESDGEHEHKIKNFDTSHTNSENDESDEDTFSSFLRKIKPQEQPPMPPVTLKNVLEYELFEEIEAHRKEREAHRKEREAQQKEREAQQNPQDDVPYTLNSWPNHYYDCCDGSDSELDDEEDTIDVMIDNSTDNDDEDEIEAENETKTDIDFIDDGPIDSSSEEESDGPIDDGNDATTEIDQLKNEKGKDKAKIQTGVKRMNDTPVHVRDVDTTHADGKSDDCSSGVVMYDFGCDVVHDEKCLPIKYSGTDEIIREDHIDELCTHVLRPVKRRRLYRASSCIGEYSCMITDETSCGNDNSTEHVVLDNNKPTATNEVSQQSSSPSQDILFEPSDCRISQVDTVISTVYNEDDQSDKQHLPDEHTIALLQQPIDVSLFDTQM